MLRALILALTLMPLALQARPAQTGTQEEIFLDARAAARASRKISSCVPV
jgi:hypothetical protein